LLYQGIKDKVAVAETICDELGISLEDVAYIGDDLGDYQLLKKVGFSGAPHNASDYIKEVVDIVTAKSGGEGAYREFVEVILTSNGYNLSELVEEITSN
jgi:YrbI family 3-deoxy-D-manno-octulosonate 8-phosphate phosphatase